MDDFDQVLAKIKNQLDSMKKSIRRRTIEYGRSTHSDEEHSAEEDQRYRPQDAEPQNLQDRSPASER